MPGVKFKREFEFIRPIERQVVKEWKQLVTGVVADPVNIDSEGRQITAEAVEKMAYNFLENFRNFGIQHQKDKDGNPVTLNDKIGVVESWVTQEEITRNGVKIPIGAWVITVRIHCSKIWKMIVDGVLKGFSFEAKVTMKELKAE